MTALKIGILGNKGRMGQTLMDEVSRTKGAELVGGVDKGDDIAAFVKKCDALIDFTAPLATLDFAALTTGKIHVIGTTGFNDKEFAALKAFGKDSKIFWSPNMSISVNLLFKLTEKVAHVLDADYDIEILEMHHRHKTDAPSGTALEMGKYAARGRGVDLSQVSDRVRDGQTGERVDGNIGFATLRGGSVIGDHTVIFASENDRLELTHKSSSRGIYAQGAIKAALWCASQPNGFYGMEDLLSNF